MKAVILTNPRAGNHDYRWRESFGEGLAKRGWSVEHSEGEKPCDLLVLWGVRRKDVIARQKAAGGEVLILERSYLGDRFLYTSTSFGGGLNGRGEFRGPHDDPSRFRRLFGNLMQPWSERDGYALLIGQVPGDQSIRHADIDAWYRQSVAALKRHGWADVRFRPHPLAGRRGGPSMIMGASHNDGPLADAFAGAGAVVTFNSNTGVEAVLAGVPTIAMDEGSMAWAVAGHQVTEIIRPDREAWAARLAWCQWTRDEMQSGECQEAIGL